MNQATLLAGKLKLIDRFIQQDNYSLFNSLPIYIISEENCLQHAFNAVKKFLTSEEVYIKNIFQFLFLTIILSTCRILISIDDISIRDTILGT